MVRKSYKSIKLKKQLKLKGVLLLFFLFTSIFSFFLINFTGEGYLPTEIDQVILDQNPILNNQGEEIFRLIYGADSGPTNLDPQNSINSDSFDVINQVCEGLFAYNLSDPSFSIIPNLAPSKGTWLINSTDSWYTISLRSNVSFHDGSKFNATAVKFTFDRLAYLINNSMAMASSLYEYYDPDVNNFRSIINQTVIVDEYTIRFELNQPYGPFEALLCFPASYIVSPISTPQHDVIDTFTGDLVGTGPFVFDHYIPDDEVLFHAYDDYWAGRANITLLKFDIISETYSTYDKIYSFTTLNEANDGSWEYWNTDIGDHAVASRGTSQYWCWTDIGTPSSPTGPPSGIACIYPETSSPTEVGDEYIATLSDTEAIDTRFHGIYVTFDTCMQGDPEGHMYFEYWDGNSWEIRDDWAGDSFTTFTARGPYDFTALEIEDFKIRFRVVVGGTIFYNDFSFDEVRIYGYLKDVDVKNLALLAGDVDIITDPQPSMFSTLNSDPDVTLNDAGHSPVTQYLSMNTKKINTTYRKAISSAINYSYIIDELQEIPADRLMSPLLEDLLYANWSLDIAIFNITKAREIMQSMGFGTGWDTTFPGTSEVSWSSSTFASFNYSYNIGNTFRENLLVLLQDNLDTIGIEIIDTGMDPLEFQITLSERNFDKWELCWLEYYSEYNDPDHKINMAFSNRSTQFNTALYNGYEAAVGSN
ncbi:MAG: ABC transporter substrate-binding protein [Promethearchaeota archaeon]|jgi:ABC-type transport system substrate-binding protein